MIITRYLTREVLYTLMAVTMILLLAFLSQQTVRYLDYVASGKIPTNILLQLLGFEVPYLLGLLLPLGLYLSILLAYGRLYADQEMAILQLCGFTEKKLLRLTLLLAIVITAIVFILVFWVNPFFAAKRNTLMEDNRSADRMVKMLMPGRFQTAMDGRYVVYLGKLSRDHTRAENVFLAQEKKPATEDGQKSWTLVLADEGYQIQDKESGGQFFVAARGYRYEGTPGQNDFKIIQFKKYAVRLPETNLPAGHPEDETLSISHLLQEYANPDRAAELQWRFSVGLSALLLAMLAVPLSRVRPRHGRYVSLLPAVLIYIVYVNLLFIARRWVEQGKIPVFLGMWWVHGLIVLCFMVILYLRRHRAGLRT